MATRRKTIKRVGRKRTREAAVGKPAAARGVAKATTQVKRQTKRNEAKFKKRTRKMAK